MYEDLEKVTRYGKADGLCGVNCRHSFRPYVHGTSRTWSDKQLKTIDPKDIEYNGEKYTEYEASQIQRGIEREIKKQKRTIAALEAAGEDASECRAKLRKSQKTYTDFTEQTGLNKQTARAKVAMGTGTEKSAPNIPTNSALTDNENGAIIDSGALSGALNDQNDPKGKKQLQSSSTFC